MTKTFNYLKREMWDGFSLNEKLFMWGMVLLQILVYIVAPDSWYGVVAGIAGCISVVLTAKGRWMMYPIGFIQNFTYTVLAFQNMFYGEVIEQVFYIVTMIWGMVAWARNMHTNEDGTQDVNTRKFGLAEWLFTIVGVVIGTWLFGRVLVAMGAAQPYTDAATNVMALFAQILMVKRYREQWVLWLLIDVFCIKMWWVAGNWSMVAMYVAWTANCIYGWMNWTKLNKKSESPKRGLRAEIPGIIDEVME
jgi:nicotinamide mononucleotide transporter